MSRFAGPRGSGGPVGDGARVNRQQEDITRVADRPRKIGRLGNRGERKQAMRALPEGDHPVKDGPPAGGDL